MADIDQNRRIWQSSWDWSDEGEVWSGWWGDSDALWYGLILPRIHPHLPAGTILEIAPGFGRWTRFLAGQCDRIELVDLTERCIEHCRARFAAADHVGYHVNDGRSLAMLEDRSIDFAFSFDSLVHVEADVLDDYIEGLADKLADEGVAFIHHSDLGSHPVAVQASHRLPARLRAALGRRGPVVDLNAWRAESASAQKIADACDRVGLRCVAQESIRWERGTVATDALSLIARRGSRWDRPTRRAVNPDVQREAARLRKLWSASGFPARGTTNEPD